MQNSGGLSEKKSVAPSAHALSVADAQQQSLSQHTQASRSCPQHHPEKEGTKETLLTKRETKLDMPAYKSMDQLAKALASKPEVLSSIPATCLVEQENWHRRVVL